MPISKVQEKNYDLAYMKGVAYMDMRISSAYSAYSLQPTRNTTNAPRTERARIDTDRVSISTQAEDYQAVRRAVANTPDVRDDLVSSIRQMLDAGTYNVSASDVASRIFQGIA